MGFGTLAVVGTKCGLYGLRLRLFFNDFERMPATLFERLHLNSNAFLYHIDFLTVNLFEYSYLLCYISTLIFEKRPKLRKKLLFWFFSNKTSKSNNSALP